MNCSDNYFTSRDANVHVALIFNTTLSSWLIVNYE